MKKFLAILTALLLAASLTAAEEATEVFVSITDDTGALVMARQPVLVTDTDGDRVVSISDALCCAHAAAHEAGAQAYSAVASEFGLSLVKLWGVDNGGSYGYYLNDASAWSLLDPVTAGDHVKAYLFTDLQTWSDTYSFFSVSAAEAPVGGELPLTLFAALFDENFLPVTAPVAGAALTVNGETTGVITGENGEATLTFDAPGEYVVSAVSETMTLVAPVCVVKVTE